MSGFLGGASGKEPACQCKKHKRHGLDPWVRKIPWRKAWQPTPMTQMVKNLPAVKETWVQSLGQENPLEKEVVTHTSILAWRIPWSLEGYSPWGHKRIGHYLAIKTTK